MVKKQYTWDNLIVYIEYLSIKGYKEHNANLYHKYQNANMNARNDTPKQIQKYILHQCKRFPCLW